LERPFQRRVCRSRKPPVGGIGLQLVEIEHSPKFLERYQNVSEWEGRVVAARRARDIVIVWTDFWQLGSIRASDGGGVQ
jgi:hypothetical protein